MIIRAKHDGKNFPYVIVSRRLLQERRLPYGPKCLLLLMLSYPDTWNFTEKFLADSIGESISTIRSFLEILKQFGYFHENVSVEFGGSQISVSWLVTEYPAEEKKNDANL